MHTKWIADYEKAEFMQYRPATIDEAVESVLRCILLESRRSQLAWFRKEYGDQFANEVEQLVKRKWKAKK